MDAANDSTRGFDFWTPVMKQQEWITTGPILSEQVVSAFEEQLDRHAAKAANDIRSTVPTDSLVRSNYRPSDAQAHFCNAILAEKMADVADIDRDAFRLQLKMNHLMDEMRVLRNLRVRTMEEAYYYKGFISPVRLLPPEILVRIFQYAVSTKPRPRRRASSPFGLSQVCSTWRNAALGFSDFWNGLSLNPGTYAPDAFGLPRSRQHVVGTLIASWYNRANKARPLSFSLTTYMSPEHLGPTITRDICQSIIHFSPRFSELHISLSYQVLMEFLSLPGGNLPMLETLSFGGDEVVNEDFPPITVFGAAPRLRTATLRVNSFLLIHGSRFALPWNQLACLEVKGTITLEAFSKVISQCPQLVTASFTGVDLEDISDHDEPVQPDDPVTFARLEAFTLELSGRERHFGIDEVLSKLRLPKVQTLEFGGDALYYGFPLDHSLWGMSDNFNGIRCLLLSYVDIEIGELIELIKSCTLLEKLTLCIPLIRPEMILRRLMKGAAGSSGQSGPSLVHLAYFTFAFSQEDIEDEGDIGDVAEGFSDLVASWTQDPSRQRPLQSVSLFVCDYLRKTDPRASSTILDRVRSRICVAGNGHSTGVTFKTNAFDSYVGFAYAIKLSDVPPPGGLLEAFRDID